MNWSGAEECRGSSRRGRNGCLSKRTYDMSAVSLSFLELAYFTSGAYDDFLFLHMAFVLAPVDVRIIIVSSHVCKAARTTVYL